MSDDNTSGGKTPVWYWIVAVLAVLWNGFGAFDYYMTQSRNADYLAAFTPEQLAYFTSFPTWFSAVWALSVFGALLGSLLLLLRNGLAIPVFILATLCYAIALVYNFGLSGGMEIMGIAGVITSLIIGLILIGLLILARWAKSRGILT